PGGAVYLKGKGLRKPILIVRTEDARFLAFANRCTHAGRKLDPVPGKPLLRCCSLSHSVFDYDGNNVKGPARKPLIRYETNLLEDELVIII
ncbi:Rieske (2Fe-2S) protein, partial [Candidatus Sumerlaeota bacterium]|nr:Rieske (2Fe-2S) protein [Candidatus Sumerlaeota bacterium]